MATISEEDKKYLTASEIAALEEMEDDDDDDIDDELDLNELDDEDVLSEEDDDAEDDGYPPAEDDDKKKSEADDTDDKKKDGDDDDADDVDNSDAESDDDDADTDGKKPDQDGADDDDTDADDDDADDEPVRTPLLTSKLPPDWKDRLTRIDTDRDKLETRFDDGEVDGKEYRTELRRLESEQRKIEMAVHEAQIAQEMEQSQSKQQWIDTVTDWLDDNKIYKENSSLHDALDSKVKRIAQDPENQKLTGRQILKKAHAQVVKDFPTLFKATEPEPNVDDNKDTGKEPPPDKDTKERKKAKVRDVPKNLSKVPAAENTPTDPGSKFAALDSLKGVELEKALARLSEAEYEEYMKQ